MPRLDLLQLRRGIASLWSSRNPTLADGELAWDKTANLLKIGDGTTNWNSLGYVGGLADGDKGDITVSASGATWTIDALAVTNAKINDVAFSKITTIGQGKLIGRHGAGTGTAQEIGIDGGLEFHGGNIRTSAITGDVSISAGGSTATIGNLAVTNAKINDVAWSKVTSTPTTLSGYGITDAITSAAVAAGYQPLDSDLTAIAALSTTSFGRGLLTETNASSIRTTLGLGINNSPSFSRVALNTGTLTTSFPAWDVTQTWNDAAVTFTALKANVTDTASNASSLLMDLQVGGSSRFSVRKDGATRVGPNAGSGFGEINFANRSSCLFTYGTDFGGQPLYISMPGGLNVVSGPLALGNPPQVELYVDSVNALAQRRTTNAQTFRIYNTTDSGTTNYERGKLEWSSNVFRIGTEKAGTGSARALELQTDGTTRLTIASSGNLQWTGSVFNFAVSDSGVIAPMGLTHSTSYDWFLLNSNGLKLASSGVIQFHSGVSTLGNPDVVLARDAANTLAQRNAGNAQTFRIYNTTDSGITNYERGKLEWSSNVFRIGTEKAGTGSARALELQTDGTTRLTIGTTGAVSSGTNNIGIGVGGFFNDGGGLGLSFAYSQSNPGFYFGSTRVLLYAGIFQLHGITSSFPAIKRNAAALNFRLADDSADCDITAAALTLSGNLTISTKDIVTDTTTGTKIGTATTQKIGFFNKSPVVQPAAVADATDAASVITQLNLLLGRMRDLGLIAT